MKVIGGIQSSLLDSITMLVDRFCQVLTGCLNSIFECRLLRILSGPVRIAVISVSVSLVLHDATGIIFSYGLLVAVKLFF